MDFIGKSEICQTENWGGVNSPQAGFITECGEPLFFVFLDAAYEGRLGIKLYYHATVRGFRDGLQNL